MSKSETRNPKQTRNRNGLAEAVSQDFFAIAACTTESIIGPNPFWRSASAFAALVATAARP